MSNSFHTNLEVLLDKLNLLSNNLKKQETVSQIDLDLMIRYTQKVYELLLEQQALKAGSPEITNQLSKKKIQAPVSKSTHEIQQNEAPAEVLSQQVFTETPKKQKKVAEPKPQKKPLVSDESEDNFDSLNKKYSKDAVLLADQLKKKPIKNLNKGIDLNDKYWFINDLFDGKPNVFNEHLNKLNNMPGLQEALNYVEQEIKAQFNWEGKERSTKKFLSFIHRRYE